MKFTKKLYFIFSFRNKDFKLLTNFISFRMFSMSDSQYEKYLKRQKIQAEKLKESIGEENIEEDKPENYKN